MRNAVDIRQRAVGLAGGSLWLIGVGATFAVWSFAAARTTLMTWLFIATSAAAVSLVFFGIAMIRGALRMPRGCDAGRPGVRKRMWLKFGMIFAAEAAGIAAVAEASLHHVIHHWRYVVPLDLIIVGLHFLPLARLFAVPRYYVLGAFSA